MEWKMNNNIRLPKQASQILRDTDGRISVIKLLRDRLGVSLPDAMRMLSENMIEIDPNRDRAVARDLLTSLRRWLPAADFQEQLPEDPQEPDSKADVKKVKAMVRHVLEQIMVIEGPTGELREGERVGVVRGNLVAMHDKLMDALNELSK